MRILASAIALAVALAWPSAGEAQSSQSKKSTAGTSATVQQKQKQATHRKTTYVRTASQPRTAQKPCAGYLWWGCVGWDPDPNVRATLVRDLAESP